MGKWSEAMDNASRASARLALSTEIPIFAGCRVLQDCLCGSAANGRQATAPCKLSIFVEGGRIKAAVNDTHGKRVGFVTLDPNLTLAEALEQALGGEGLEWRPVKEQPKGAWRG